MASDAEGGPETVFKETTFMGRAVTFNKSRAVVVPVPYSSNYFTHNTLTAPSEILRNWNMEDYDLNLGYSPCAVGIYPLPERTYEGQDGFELIGKVANAVFQSDKFPVFLGGDQALAIATTKAATQKYKDLTVFFFDAHADLKETFEGSRIANMCSAKRVGEITKTVQIGVRSVGSEELDAIEEKDAFEHITDKELNDMIKKAGKNVYISIDVDVFDPSLMPATPMPEQSGPMWDEIMSVLERIAAKKNIVGCDICELSPIDGMGAQPALCAQLAYKLIGMKFEAEAEEKGWKRGD